ncbi:flagellar biosynthesis regulator FlaF [Acetobacter sp.]|uniref:flagellar biosynthesis regulator FlaF n=1 Tax=Acetobacter sp. TaxID=440 RepID=UPI0039E7C535
MNYGLKRYNQNTANAMSPRQVESMAFGQTIALLKNASDHKKRIHALSMNQKLWSAVLREVGMESNDTPEVVKNDLLKLAVWSTRYSIRAMLHDLPLKPLIDVNQDMLDGLRDTSSAKTVDPSQQGNFKLSVA